MEKKKAEPKKWVLGKVWMDELCAEVNVTLYLVEWVVKKGEDQPWEMSPMPTLRRC